MSHVHVWKREDAERSLGEVLQRAKNGQTQFIQDAEGEFEIRFLKARADKAEAGDFLSRGGPIDES
ncbi:hypothetical protein IB276_05695 [Ensifer sp. ENS04]|uniref:hypothetical protein n=1 Tax=Ensifer sp. ENS04 TaxID=2769281 RepID=UPI0017832097|nr:hypothetical protein [Ensifer sp. ENS04]MBD9538933.1 hypothetical protein [Ensifer sp. ENS04]